MTEPDIDLPELAVRFLDALLDSASVDLIGVANWWLRATSALRVAASAQSYGHAVSAAAGKLQIDVLSAGSSKALAGLEASIAPEFGQWCAVADREAEYVVALARLARSSRSAARKAARDEERIEF